MKKNICVFCGASDGNSPEYQQQAIKLGYEIAEQGRTLIYGGGSKGLMGIIADAVLEKGGEVIGIMPKHLVEAETAHHGITCLEIVSDMHSRKARLSELADAFVAMPGGTGTLEEFFEVWTAMQIGYHEKPVAFYDVNQFWQPMNTFLTHSVESGFIRDSFYKTLITETNPAELLHSLDLFVPKELNRWIKK